MLNMSSHSNGCPRFKYFQRLIGKFPDLPICRSATLAFLLPVRRLNILRHVSSTVLKCGDRDVRSKHTQADTKLVRRRINEIEGSVFMEVWSVFFSISTIFEQHLNLLLTTVSRLYYPRNNLQKLIKTQSFGGVTSTFRVI